MEYIGKYGEHVVLANLLKRNIEAYFAIRANQDDYDITVITEDKKILRIQVKATELNNKSTNNPISGTEKFYDYLVLVIVSNFDKFDKFFVLSKAEVERIKGSSKRLYTTAQCKGEFRIKKELLQYKDKWDKIETRISITST